MDFDCIKEVEQNSRFDSNLELQTTRLITAIKNTRERVEKGSNVKICPFIGFDLRKLLPIDEEGELLDKNESIKELEKLLIPRIGIYW